MKKLNPYGKFNGALIPDALLEYSELSHLAKIIWAKLVQYAGKDGLCYPSMKTLATKTSMSESSIYKFLKELETTGFIVRASGNEKTPNSYEFLLHPVLEDHLDDSEIIEEEEEEEGTSHDEVGTSRCEVGEDSEDTGGVPRDARSNNKPKSKSKSLNPFLYRKGLCDTRSHDRKFKPEESIGKAQKNVRESLQKRSGYSGPSLLRAYSLMLADYGYPPVQSFTEKEQNWAKGLVKFLKRTTYTPYKYLEMCLSSWPKLREATRDVNYRYRLTEKPTIIDLCLSKEVILDGIFKLENQATQAATTKQVTYTNADDLPHNLRDRERLARDINEWGSVTLKVSSV